MVSQRRLGPKPLNENYHPRKRAGPADTDEATICPAQAATRPLRPRPVSPTNDRGYDAETTLTCQEQSEAVDTRTFIRPIAVFAFVVPLPTSWIEGSEAVLPCSSS